MCGWILYFINPPLAVTAKPPGFNRSQKNAVHTVMVKLAAWHKTFSLQSGQVSVNKPHTCGAADRHAGTCAVFKRHIGNLKADHLKWPDLIEETGNANSTFLSWLSATKQISAKERDSRCGQTPQLFYTPKLHQLARWSGYPDLLKTWPGGSEITPTTGYLTCTVHFYSGCMQKKHWQ